MKKALRKLSMITLAFCLILTNLYATHTNAESTPVGTTYQAYVQDIGWQGVVSNGEIAGTTEMNLRMEAIKINLQNAPAGAAIKYKAYVQDIGWQAYVTNGKTSGTIGSNLRIEAIRIYLVNLPGYSVQYQVYQQNNWMQWVSNNGIAGITGLSLQIEAIRIRIIKNVTSISVTSAGTVNAGGTLQMNAVVYPEDATDKTLTWSVSSAGLKATIDAATGLLYAIKASTVTVTAAASNGIKGRMIVIIKGPPKITNVSIISNNANTKKATLGNIITLKFTSNEPVVMLDEFRINGRIPDTFTNVGNNYTATHLVNSSDPITGLPVTFRISVMNAAGISSAPVIKSSNSSSVTIIHSIIQLTIAAPDLTVEKFYDGTDSADVTAGSLIGIVAGDDVTVSASASYDSASAGTGKTITVKYTLGGAASNNYSAPSDYIVTNGVIKTTLQDQSIIDAMNLIDALPKKYSGITLLGNNIEEINSIVNVSSVIKDTSVNLDGVSPIKITSASGGEEISTKFGKIFSQVKDLSSLTNIELLLWFYDLKTEIKLSDLRVDLVTDSNNYFYLYIDTDSWLRSPGACRVRYDIASFSKVGNPDISSISKINFRMTGNPGMIESVGILNVSYNARSIPKTILTFDDGWQDTYTNAYPILAAQGFKGVSYVVSDFVQGNDPNYMRKSSLDILYNAGWDISNHSQNHERYDPASIFNASYMKNSIKNCLDFLLGCGYERSARFYCYPDGKFDDELIAMIKEIGIVSARTTITGFIAEPPPDLLKLKTACIGHDTTFGTGLSSDIKASIDKAISSGETMAIMMHRVYPDNEMDIPGDPTNEIKTSISMLTQVTQYLKSTGVEVCTMSQWYDELTTTPQLTLANKAQVQAARIAYDNLADSQKALVTNYKVLTDAESKIASLEN